MLQAYEQHSKRKLATIILALVIVAGIVVAIDQLRPQDQTADTAGRSTATSESTSDSPAEISEASNPAQSPNTTNETPSGTFKDGTYSAASDYFVPPGNENIEVTVTLASQVITDISVKNSENDRQSADFQDEFTAGYKSKVVGQKLRGFKLSSVAGASDTTRAFNDALDQIASKAQS
jgi:uncharacterized protein with FMN-binding domain